MSHTYMYQTVYCLVSMCMRACVIQFVCARACIFVCASAYTFVFLIYTCVCAGVCAFVQVCVCTSSNKFLVSLLQLLLQQFYFELTCAHLVLEPRGCLCTLQP